MRRPLSRANELTARDTDNNGSDNYSLAYDEVGNMTDDGKEYEYVYDPFGRLRKIKNTSNQALVAEYWYNGLGHRISWHSDTSRSGGGAPDGTVDTNDPKVHFIYNERWQQVATYRQANGSSIDTHPKEQFVNHAAGLAGYGSSSYIDGVILRDDHEDDWTEAADSTMERRVYYCQNWRADVVALLSENGRVLERAWYEPYGTPHGVSPADFSGTSDDTNDHYLVPDGDADADDSFVYLDLFGLSAGLSDTTGSSDPGDPEYGRPNGTVDSDDYFYYLDQYSVAAVLGRNVLSSGHDGATASHGAGNLRNRKGLAGYEWDPHVRRYHVRNRVLYPEIGRWTRRDPLGYVDGMGLYVVAQARPIRLVDPTGESSLEPDSGVFALKDIGSVLSGMSDKHEGGYDVQARVGCSVCFKPWGPFGARVCVNFEASFAMGECCCYSVDGDRNCSSFTRAGGCLHVGVYAPLTVGDGNNCKLKKKRTYVPRGSLGGISNCPLSSGCSGAICFTGSIGLREISFGCRVCFVVTGGGGLEPRVRCGFNVGSGTGVSLGGCFNCTQVVGGHPCYAQE